jgi:hypothetical protein
MDLVLLGRCQALGYEVSLRVLNKKVTPQNRLIAARVPRAAAAEPPAEGAGVAALACGECAATPGGCGAVCARCSAAAIDGDARPSLLPPSAHGAALSRAYVRAHAPVATARKGRAAKPTSPR